MSWKTLTQEEWEVAEIASVQRDHNPSVSVLCFELCKIGLV